MLINISGETESQIENISKEDGRVQTEYIIEDNFQATTVEINDGNTYSYFDIMVNKTLKKVQCIYIKSNHFHQNFSTNRPKYQPTFGDYPKQST